MKQAITRLVVLAILLINQTLVVFGWNPLPFSEEEIYEGVSVVATICVAIWTWWKNNSVTEEAQVSDRILKDAKRDKKAKRPKKG
ncbi:phage holin [Oceanobacillus oncorhynchi]|uniref:phage holin n=1 Tax=Oceanobacillus oncorhynchi TaxID=545501 RepID=UPI0018661656|nr:phage holin [Oceanobacillus oncorhynchi]